MLAHDQQPPATITSPADSSVPAAASCSIQQTIMGLLQPHDSPEASIAASDSLPHQEAAHRSPAPVLQAYEEALHQTALLLVQSVLLAWVMSSW